MAQPNHEGLLAGLVNVADLLLTEDETEVVMRRMAQVLTGCIPDVVSASVTVQTGRPLRHGYRLVAASDQIADDLDQAQYKTDAGPCVQALVHGREVVVPEFPVQAWPEFNAAARRNRVDWSVSVPSRNGHHEGVLNVYGRGPGRYDEAVHLEPVRVFARYAATILAAHTRYLHATTEVDQLHEAMASRGTIEQAKGMIMLRERCTADEAFAILVRTSQHRQRKLHHIAADVIAAAREDAGPAPQRTADAIGRLIAITQTPGAQRSSEHAR